MRFVTHEDTDNDRFDNPNRMQIYKRIGHRANETFFNNSSFLLGSDGEGGAYPIQPGTYQYPFSFQLPHRLPSSFVGAHGKIRQALIFNMRNKKA